MMVIYLPVKFEFEFEFEFYSLSPETAMLSDKQTNKWTKLHQFRKQLSYDGDLSPCKV